MIRIVGVGSPLGDDAIAWHVITRLQDSLPAGVDAVSLDRPGPDLLRWLENTDEVIIVDALLDDAATSYRKLNLDQLATLQQIAPSCHGLGLAETLRLGEALGMLPPALTIYGIPLSTIDGDTLSDTARELAESLAVDIQHTLNPIPARNS